MKLRTTPWPLVAMACTALAACGGGEPAEAPPAVAAPQGVFGTAPAAAGGTPSVITLVPAGGAPALPPRESPVMDQLGLAFNPMFLLVRTGETVRFPNSETITHNVKLTISDTDSVVADYETDPGAVAEHVMDVAGGYEVTCDHHPGMRAFIYVTSAPYVTFADNAGAFRIPDVPPGSYTLEVWSVDPTRRSQRTVEVTGPSTEVSLTATP
jgi:plastocyanin